MESVGWGQGSVGWGKSLFHWCNNAVHNKNSEISCRPLGVIHDRNIPSSLKGDITDKQTYRNLFTSPKLNKPHFTKFLFYRACQQAVFKKENLSVTKFIQEKDFIEINNVFYHLFYPKTQDFLSLPQKSTKNDTPFSTWSTPLATYANGQFYI